ncbi:hypothetical protein ABZ863_16040 [Saccharomonospora sp. NPDC046836]|uniref:TetR/AcrR family transcriptional regulator n=1 Tax=Saccharomonospora sp. NPDC046836 TaxID=3156921 RepID=UPI0033FB0047
MACSFGTQLASRLDGPDAALRGELLAALLSGIGLLCKKIGTSAMTNADRETLTAYVDRMVEPLHTPAGDREPVPMSDV